jgi:hypothetical protein
MFTNNIKIGWRRLSRNTGYTLINIGGLAIGLTVALFIWLWVYDELSFNKYHKNYDSIGQARVGEQDRLREKLAEATRYNIPWLQLFKQIMPDILNMFC